MVVALGGGGASEVDAHMSKGEALLRSVDDQEELCRILCTKGEIACMRGDLPTAHAAHAEAKEIATGLRVLPTSDLARAVVDLSHRLSDTIPTTTAP